MTTTTTAPDAERLCGLLSQLATTPRVRAELERILSAVTSSAVVDGVLTLSFGSDHPTWEIAFEGDRIREMDFGERGRVGGISFHDGEDGTLHALGSDCGLDEQRDGFGYSDELIAPVDVGLSVYYVFEPGTTSLRRFDMDGGLDEPVIPGGPGEAFLKELAHGLAQVVDDFPATPPAATTWRCPTNDRRWKIDWVRAVAGHGDVLATLTMAEPSMLHLWDISRVSDVQALGSLARPQAPNHPCPQIALAASRALILRTPLLDEVDVADPARPRLVESGNDATLPSISFGGAVVFATDQHVYRVHVRAGSIRELSVTARDGRTAIIDRGNDFVFVSATPRMLVAGGREGMAIYDLADPLAPVKQGSVAFSADLDVCAVPVGDRHVVVTSYSGAFVVDLAARRAIRLELESRPRAVCADGDTIYVATSHDDEGVVLTRYALADGRREARALLLAQDGTRVFDALWMSARADELLVLVETSRFAAFRLTDVFRGR